VALSRARLGLYILGRREIFEACFELRPAFELLLQRPDKLVLATGEMWPSQRVLADEKGSEIPGEAVMEGLEHLGQFVYEMTTARVKQMRAEQGLPELPAGADGQTAGLESIEETAERALSDGEGEEEDEGEKEGGDVNNNNKYDSNDK
jgi:intron-binding protein aquarius